MFAASAASRDSEFTEFVESATSSLGRTAYLLTGDRELAADLVQEALVRTYVAWRRVRRGEALGYARRTLVNLNIDRWRRRPAVPAESVDGVAESGESSVDDRDQVVRALAALPAQQRRVIVLRYLDDLTEAGVAEHLGISVGAVKSACSRGLAAMRRAAVLTEEESVR
ncbi:MAG: SigE family RNA polymerase sigma factor [Propionibacteriaceae bacterium]|jgi:RNA polymerase sigma-70 factor (sigma-E family)|nr:SigE family RNA polymerase sigma factor [Propionibacteriaceae bacterium]